MPDNQIGYEFAGPGRRRRERLALADNVQSPTPRTIKPKSPSERNSKRETREITGQGLKARIRRLTLQGASYPEVCDELASENISASGILVSNVRTDTRETIQLLIEEGLLDEQRLEAFRRQHERGRKG